MFHLFWQNWQPHENVFNSDWMSRPLSFYFPSGSLKCAHNGFIWLFRYFWSTWLPSGYVPSGWAIQTLLRPQQSWSGGLHKLLSVSAQVGGIQQTRFFALCLCVHWCLDSFSLTVRNRKSRAWCRSWLIWGMPHSLPSVSLSSLYCCLRYCYDEVECVATLWDLFKMMVYFFSAEVLCWNAFRQLVFAAHMVAGLNSRAAPRSHYQCNEGSSPTWQNWTDVNSHITQQAAVELWWIWTVLFTFLWTKYRPQSTLKNLIPK